MIKKAGNYDAKVKTARLIESSKESLGVELEFETIKEEETISRVLWLTEKAKPYTVKTLVEVMESDNVWDIDSEGYLTSTGFVNYDKTYSLVVEMEEAEDKEGNTKVSATGEIIYYPRIQWINNVGGSSYAGVNQAKAATKLKQLGIEAAMLMAKKGQQQQVEDTTSEIPF